MTFDAVLFDFRGTLFNVEDDPTWIRNAALSIGRALTDEAVAETCRRLNETLAARPDLKEGLDRCDTSLDVHRAALLAWFAATGLDDELAHAIWARDSDDPAANFPYPDTEPVMRTLHEPPVISAARTGSLYLGSLSTSWMFIMRQSASSSSATICAMADDTCWPISALPTITVILPSGAIEYQAVGSNLPAASASLTPCTPETAT